MISSVLILMMVAGCVSAPQAREPAAIPVNASPGRPYATIPTEQLLTFAGLRNEIVQGKLTSIEATLRRLYAGYPEYLQFHTLMYNSLSLHGSSFREPRAIVFGPDTKFILSFNGGVHQKHGDAMETVEYSVTRHAFLFREIAFKVPTFRREEIDLRPDEIAYEDDRVLISKANPAKCLQCHGQNASPIWASYFTWPGAYGSNDDNLQMVFNRAIWNGNNEAMFQNADRPLSQARHYVLKDGAKDAEVAGYVTYLKNKTTHPRYRWLPDHVADASYRAWSNGKPFAKLDATERANAESTRLNSSFQWPMRPNLFLLDGLIHWNQDRLLAVLQSHNLDGAFRSSAWSVVTPELKSDVSTMAKMVEAITNTLSFRQKRPSLARITEVLSENLTVEAGMQRERIYLHDRSLGGHVLRPYKEDRYQGFGPGYLSNTVAFYSRLLNIPNPNELDEIAFTHETDDRVHLTALQLALADNGIKLEDYVINVRQLGLNFHSDGLNMVSKYLGIDL